MLTQNYFQYLINKVYTIVENSQTLYKLNSFNEISWWTISISQNIVTIRWGNRLPITENNNVQETPFPSEELALAKYYSLIREQTDRKGYTTEIVYSKPDLPMLCQEYDEVPKWNSFALQPKLDGIRCIFKNGELFTRKNRRLGSCPHIEMYLNHIPENVKLDGELYIPRTPMNVIESVVMRDRPQVYGTPTYSVVEYHVFDIIDSEVPFRERHEYLKQLLEELGNVYVKWRDPNHPVNKHPYRSYIFPFKLVPTTIHNQPPSQEIIDGHFRQCRNDGYEGSIIRNADANYEVDTRSKHILKKKEFYDHEFKIIDVIEGKNKVGVFVCETHSGSDTFNCSFRADSTKRRQILTYRHNYIGKWLRIEHEGINPDSGIPRCPVGIHYYDKKDHE